MAKNAKQKPATSLLDIAKSLPAPRKQTFFDRLDAESKSELLKLREAFQASSLPAHLTAGRIYEDVFLPRFGPIITPQTFRRWIDSKEGS